MTDAPGQPGDAVQQVQPLTGHMVEVQLRHAVGVLDPLQQRKQVGRAVDQKSRHVQRIDRLAEHADAEQLEGIGGLPQVALQGLQRQFAFDTSARRPGSTLTQAGRTMSA